MQPSDHVKYTTGDFEFRVFLDGSRIEVEGPGHNATLVPSVAQLYYEFFKLYEKDLQENKDAAKDNSVAATPSE